MHARVRDSRPLSSSSNSSAPPGWPGPSCSALLCHPLFSLILPPGTCFCQVLSPFPAPLLLCPPSHPSPAAQAVVSFPTSLMWVTCRSWEFWLPPIHLCLPLLKSIREYGKPGRSWHIVPVVGSSVGRRPRPKSPRLGSCLQDPLVLWEHRLCLLVPLQLWQWGLAV